ncbi:hypothetical protein GDO78_009892 [Eleutherodactylus coqui]|uniref:Cystatin domain-containing protein n=1 Tax=Eleutherodactylus coqui TaxID=57060 RepID=A0A8J6KCX9_ELECQ|nr:hypothetical protein GDO78_009892 [Eleutherodactylus coqui]KAG9484219.1 hypothetical protein GDO78_009892 [Eleutherodactylus coqui]KAG9484220.1 hypothetical protein GDO78_009892 [Eleutherodactylus coqui]
MAINPYTCFIVASFLACAIGGGMMTGSYTSIPTNNTNVVQAANFAVMRYNQQSNDAHFYKRLDISSAEKQLVNGINYMITMQIGETSCRKNEVSGSGSGPSCDVANSDVLKIKSCIFKVYKSFTPEQLSLQNVKCTLDS